MDSMDALKGRGAVRDDALPEELKALRQWVVWRYERRRPQGKGRGGEAKPTKVPWRARPGEVARRASVTGPSTWSTFPEAMEVYRSGGYDGVGFVLVEADTYCGIDLDGCRDPATGGIEEWALRIVGQLDSYTEVSPSRRGLRVLLRGTLPPGRRRKGPVEIYSEKRFLTITGSHLEGTPDRVERRQAEIMTLHASVFGPGGGERAPAGAASSKGVQPALGSGRRTGEREGIRGLELPGSRSLRAGRGSGLTDEQVLRIAQGAANGPAFSALWEGDMGAYTSRSEADAALCAYLAYYTGDPEQIDRLFSASALVRPKWIEREDYRVATINYAISLVERSRATANDPPDEEDEAWEAQASAIADDGTNREGEWLARYDRDSRLGADLLRLMGVGTQFAPGQPFPSPLRQVAAGAEGESGKVEPAVIYRNKHGIYKYREGARRYTLAQVYAAYISGVPVVEYQSMPHVTMAVWKLRLLLELGRIPDTGISIAHLPAGAPRSSQEAYAGFVLLLRCRQAYSGEPGPAPYTYRWAERWVPMSFDRARRGIKWLLEQGYLVEAGKECGCTLYLPASNMHGGAAHLPSTQVA